MSKKNTKNFREMLKETEVKVPQQKVEPIQPPESNISQQMHIFPDEESKALESTKKRTKDNEVQLNVHIDAGLLKGLKLKGVNEGKNIKQMISEAIKLYVGTI